MRRSGIWLASAKASGSPARRLPAIPIPCAKPAPRDDRASHSTQSINNHPQRHHNIRTTGSVFRERIYAFFDTHFGRLNALASCCCSTLHRLLRGQPDLRPRASLPNASSASPRRKFGFRFAHVTTTPNVLHSRLQCTACSSTETQHKTAAARNQGR